MSAVTAIEPGTYDPAMCAIRGESEADRRIGLINAGIADPDTLYVGAAEVHAAYGQPGLRSYLRSLQKRLERGQDKRNGTRGDQ